MNNYTYKSNTYTVLHKNYKRREGWFWWLLEWCGIKCWKWKVTIKYVDDKTSNVYERSEKEFKKRFVSLA